MMHQYMHCSWKWLLLPQDHVNIVISTRKKTKYKKTSSAWAPNQPSQLVWGKEMYIFFNKDAIN